MDYMSLVWILVSLAGIRLLLSLLPSGNKKLPPGPYPWPIVGNLFLIGSSPHKSMTELANIHGPLMYLRLGSLNTVVVSSAAMAKQVLLKNDGAVCGRPVPDSFTGHHHHELSLLFMPISERWKSFRKACSSVVFSRSRLDSSRLLRKNKLEGFISYLRLRGEAGEAVDLGQLAFDTVFNLLSNTFLSFDLADPNSTASNEFKHVFTQILMETSKPNLADYFPVLKWADPQRIRRRVEAHFGKLLQHFSSIVSQRLQSAKQGRSGEIGDTLDALLNISHEDSDELPLSHLPDLLMELFIAGTDTTSNTVEWAMTELLRNPDKMNKARQELQLVVGKGVAVKEEDFPKLPYLQAVIRETLRMHGTAPFIFRQAESEIEVCGFTIPKNSHIIINLWAVGKDPSVWNNPMSFYPERFLGEESDIKDREFKFIPFGAGRRICPGQPLAMRMIPLLLGSLINCFDWKLEDGFKPENIKMDAKIGLTLQKVQPLRTIPIAII